MITKSKDDTATWNFGRWTWTIVLPLVAMLLAATVAGQDRFVFIGGNSQARVIPCAKKLGASYFAPSRPNVSPKVAMKENLRWIDGMMNRAVPIIDLGPDPRLGGKIGPFYDMERDRVLRHGGIMGRPYSKYYDLTKWSETEGNTTWNRLLKAAHDCARHVTRFP